MGEKTKTRRKDLVLDVINDFQKKRVLVIGDSILDMSFYGTAVGLSLETPTLKAREEKIEYSWGGASNVVKNLLELGAKTSFITLLGEDSEAESYTRFKHKNFKLFPITEKGRKTTTKKRFWVEQRGVLYKYLQFDRLDNREIEKKSEEKIIRMLQDQLKKYDTVLLVDYRHGMMSKNLINQIKNLTKKNNIMTIASSQISESRANHLDYSRVDLICMNYKEAKEISGDIPENQILSNLEKKLDSSVCVTSGEKGSELYLNSKKYHVKAIDIEEKDSCGAGDSFLAALSLSPYESHPKESLYLANIFGGLSATKISTQTPKKQELLDYINKGK